MSVKMNQELEGKDKTLWSITPLYGNVDIHPGIMDNGFKFWKDIGITTIKYIFEKEELLSFE